MYTNLSKFLCVQAKTHKLISVQRGHYFQYLSKPEETEYKVLDLTDGIELLVPSKTFKREFAVLM